jgi:hypothetical protein
VESTAYDMHPVDSAVKSTDAIFKPIALNLESTVLFVEPVGLINVPVDCMMPAIDCHLKPVDNWLLSTGFMIKSIETAVQPSGSMTQSVDVAIKPTGEGTQIRPAGGALSLSRRDDARCFRRQVNISVKPERRPPIRRETHDYFQHAVAESGAPNAGLMSR